MSYFINAVIFLICLTLFEVVKRQVDRYLLKKSFTALKDLLKERGLYKETQTNESQASEIH